MSTMEEKLDAFILKSETSYKEIKNICADNQKTLRQLDQKVTKLDGKVTAVEKKHHLLETRVNNFENSTKASFAGITKRINDAETSCKFVGDKYDDIKLKVDNNAIGIQALKDELDETKNDLKNEKINRNDDAQHFRSSFYLKFHGIPWQEGEESFKIQPDNSKVRTGGACNMKSLHLIYELVTTAGIENFSAEQVDACHRTSQYYLAPIIVLFSRKRDRENLFRQRSKLGNLNVLSYDELKLQCDEVKLRAWREQQEKNVPNKDWSAELPRINIREYLTSANSSLLNAVMPVARAKQYKHPGYLLGRRIHVRKTDTSAPIEILVPSDIAKIV